jgi:hypothetical protein
MDEYISFEEFCIDIFNIPYYNFFHEEEYEYCHSKYEKYLESKKYTILKG